MSKLTMWYYFQTDKIKIKGKLKYRRGFNGIRDKERRNDK
jgi:hypothetical protein